MKINRSYFVSLNEIEKKAIIEHARDIDQGISADEFVEVVEQMLFDSFMLGTIEDVKET